jgi:cell division protein FtsQ
MLLAAVCGYGWWAWQTRMPHRLAEQARASLIQRSLALGLRVKEIYVEGRRNTPPAALLKSLGVERGAPILFIDINEARTRILALPWVRDVSVERVLPDAVVVHLVERRPMALWQNQGRFALIDEDGKVIQGDQLWKFADLLVVVGDDAPQQTAALLATMRTEPELMALVKAAVRVSGRRWDLRLADGIDVRMPEENLARGWRRLAEYQRHHGLLGSGLQTIDLRFPDRLIVRPVRATSNAREARGKDA